MSAFTRPRSSTLRTLSWRSPAAPTHHRTLSVSAIVRTAPRRTQDFNSGFSSSYDPTEDAPRGPMFNKSKFGVPQFYPRDLKKRVDDYVVGQDRAKKTICSVIFNHYQGARRRFHQEEAERALREKQQRQKFARDRDLHDRHRVSHPVEGQPYSDSVFQRYADDAFREDEFPGHYESIQASQQSFQDPTDNFYAPEDTSLPQNVKIDKSNLLLIGPTGVGKTYILEYVLEFPFRGCVSLLDWGNKC